MKCAGCFIELGPYHGTNLCPQCQANHIENLKLMAEEMNRDAAAASVELMQRDDDGWIAGQVGSPLFCLVSGRAFLPSQPSEKP